MRTSSLLQEAADALIKTQLKNLGSTFDGGFLCPSCHVIYGRSIDAIYAFVVAYKHFRDAKYLVAARQLFSFSSTLLCADGGLYNDL